MNTLIESAVFILALGFTIVYLYLYSEMYPYLLKCYQTNYKNDQFWGMLGLGVFEVIYATLGFFCIPSLKGVFIFMISWHTLWALVPIVFLIRNEKLVKFWMIISLIINLFVAIILPSWINV